MRWKRRNLSLGTEVNRASKMRAAVRAGGVNRTWNDAVEDLGSKART